MTESFFRDVDCEEFLESVFQPLEQGASNEQNHSFKEQTEIQISQSSDLISIVQRETLQIQVEQEKQPGFNNYKDLIRTAIIPKLKDFIIQTTKGLTVKRNRKSGIKKTTLHTLVLNEFQIEQVQKFIRAEQCNFVLLQQLLGVDEIVKKEGTKYAGIRKHCLMILRSTDFLLSCLNSNMNINNKIGFLLNLEKIVGYAIDPTTCISYERPHGTR